MIFKMRIIFILFMLCSITVCQDANEVPFYSSADPMMSKLSQIQFAGMPTLKADKYPDIDAHQIITPLMAPMMEVFEQMQENSRARAQADKIAKDRDAHPFSTSRSLWEMLQRLQQPTTTTTEAPPLIERLFKPYLEPWQKQLDDFSKDMAGITLIPPSTTTPAPTTTTTQNILEKSLSVFFPSLRRKPTVIPTLPPTTSPTPRLFDPDMFDRLFFKRDKRQAPEALPPAPAPAPKFDLFTVPPPPPIFQEWEKPILGIANPFTLNPLMKMFTTPKPMSTLSPLPKIEDLMSNNDKLLQKPFLPEPKFKLQDPFYNPLFPNRKSKLFDMLAGGEAARLLG